AAQEGIVAGGGVALLRATKELDSIESDDRDILTGVKIVRRAMEEPLRRIARNAGIDGAIVVEKVLAAEGGYGFNAANGKYEDLLAAGIIDPAKVVRTALQNAASIAGLMLTTDATITDAPEKKKAGGAGMHGGEDYE
ncbi:MAG: chaperonin GroEL, partial [Acidobacteriota bacterium]|nr:chaperonin GroEL [Acidobacteriota bacterium]